MRLPRLGRAERDPQVGPFPPTSAEERALLAVRAGAMRAVLFERVLPYWRRTVDTEHGGYLLADDLKGRRTATSKQLVSQARLVWTLSAAHLASGVDGYLDAASSGYRFLNGQMLDRDQGGYAWLADLAGNIADGRKILYGQAFVIFAFVEYHRASGDAEPLERALDLFRLVDRHAHDDEHGGWSEHFTGDWQPILHPERDVGPEIPGLKSANAHLHWMEALAELYEATGDAGVRERLDELLRLHLTFFYPADGARSWPHRHPDWRPGRERTVSHGHVVEAAWLVARAERVLGREPSWDHFWALLSYSLRYGFDWQRSGLFTRSHGARMAFDRDKAWWAQAELLAALSDALVHDPANGGYARALLRLLDFVESHLALSDDGIWISVVDERGRPKDTQKAGPWKAGYHEVRAMLKFVGAFGPGPSPAGAIGSDTTIG